MSELSLIAPLEVSGEFSHDKLCLPVGFSLDFAKEFDGIGISESRDLFAVPVYHHSTVFRGAVREYGVVERVIFVDWRHVRIYAFKAD